MKSTTFMCKKLYNSSSFHEFAVIGRHFVSRIDYVITHDSASKILRKSSENHREIIVHVELCIRSKTNDVIPNNDTFEHEAFVTVLMFARLYHD